MKTCIRISFYVAAFSLLFASCSDFFEPDSDDKLLESDHYKNVSEVYSAFVGTAAVFQEAASHALILNELLGAQTIPTETAPENYWRVAKYDFSPDNESITPEPFYKVIINCNDFLRHITAFGERNPGAIEEAYYKGMISQAINFRAWCYLMLGKLYGEAVYFDDALNDYRDMSGYPSLTLEQLLPELIAFVKNGVDGIGGLNGLDWSTFLNIPNDVSWNRVSVDGNVLLGEMYLWQKDYLNALRHLRVNTDITTGDQTNRWKLSAQYGNASWSAIFGGTVGATSETITAIPFDATKNQTNPAYVAYIFRYDLAPTDSLIGMFNRQVMTNGRIGDLYRRNNSIGTITDFETMGKIGDICRKYRTAGSPIIVSRAAELHLMMAEALAGLGRFEEAMILVNLGARPYWTTVESTSFLLPPMNDPLYNADWRENRGVRGRVDLQAVDYTQRLPQNPTEQDEYEAVLSCIADETEMELAFEGRAWHTLLRLSRTIGKPDFMLDRVLKKFPEGDRALYRDRLVQNNMLVAYPKHN